MTLGSRFFAFNMRRQPFDDNAFRLALAHAVPYEEIVETVEFGLTKRSNGLINQTLAFWYNPNAPLYEFDLEKARKTLSEAGYEWDDKGAIYYPQGRNETLKPAWGP
jgi:peptide/nickel transport system substrate-binding protein